MYFMKWFIVFLFVLTNIIKKCFFLMDMVHHFYHQETRKSDYGNAILSVLEQMLAERK